MTPAALLTALLASAGPAGADRLAVLAVHDPPVPDGELSELAHQLRAAALDRVAGVLTAPEMRDRLAGRSGGATVQELDRAFGGALAVYQNGEFESAARTLKAIVADLEELPESEAVWSQWTRAMSRLSHVYLSMNQPEELEATQIALLKVDSTHQLDPVLYAPGFRARFEEVRQRVRALPKRRLNVTARGRGGTIYVSGRDVGPTPTTVILPAGTYRVAGAAGALRIPSFTVDLTAEDRAVVLDFALAEAFRPSAGPGMLLPPGERAAAIIRAGAWLGVERLVTASRSVEGGAHFLVGAIYDVRRGALLREGSVRMISGGAPPASLGALASFLLTGQASREVQERTHEPVASPRPAAPRPQPVAASAPAQPPASPVTPGLAHGPGLAGALAPAAAAPSPATPSAPVPAHGAALLAAGASPPVAPAPVASPPAAPANPLGARPAPVAHSRPGPTAPRPAAGQATLAAAPPAPAAPSKPAAISSALPAASPPPTAAKPLGSVAAPAAATPGPAGAPDLHAHPLPDDPTRLAVASRAGPGRPLRWLRPAAIGGGALAAVLGGVAVQQAFSARGAWREADAMVLADGTLRPGATPAAHTAALARGDTASRHAWLAGGSAALSAAAAGVLYWLSREPAPSR